MDSIYMRMIAGGFSQGAGCSFGAVKKYVSELTVHPPSEEGATASH